MQLKFYSGDNRRARQRAVPCCATPQPQGDDAGSFGNMLECWNAGMVAKIVARLGRRAPRDADSTPAAWFAPQKRRARPDPAMHCVSRKRVLLAIKGASQDKERGFSLTAAPRASQWKDRF